MNRSSSLLLIPLAITTNVLLSTNSVSPPPQEPSSVGEPALDQIFRGGIPVEKWTEPAFPQIDINLLPNTPKLRKGGNA